MLTKILGAVVAIVLVASACGGSTGVSDTAAQPASDSNTAAAGSDDGASEGEAFDRESFVLCTVIESNKDELAGIIGFDVDPERGVETSATECNIRGLNPGDFARVLLAPGFTPSIEVHAAGYDGPSSPVPELGAEAVFIESDFQPHVIFLVGDLIIDVDAEVLPTTSRETMVAYALRVRELLAEGNS